MSTGSPIQNQDTANEAVIIGDPFNSVVDRELDNVGDGSGVVDMNTLADSYLIEPPINYVYVIDELKISIGEWKLGPFILNRFAGLPALVNGIDLEIRSPLGDVLRQLFSGVQTNAELCTLGVEEFGAGDLFLSVTIRWPEPLRIKYQHPLVLQTNDDLSLLVYMRARAKGRSFRAR